MIKTWILICAALSLSAPVPCKAVPHESPFACNRAALTDTDRKRHFDELGPALQAIVKNVRELPDGYDFQFPTDPATFRLVAEWAAGEHLCCPFFDIELRQERENGPFWMRLSGRPGVKQFIESDLGKWMKRGRGFTLPYSARQPLDLEMQGATIFVRGPSYTQKDRCQSF